MNRTVLRMMGGAFLCAAALQNMAGQQDTPTTEFGATGVVCHAEINGGFYSLHTDEGLSYFPGDSLPEAFRKAPLRVRFEAKKTGISSNSMEIIEVLKIAQDTSEPPRTQPKRTPISVTGTVVYVEVEGGFYGIKADNGRRFDPGNSLPEKFRKKDHRVRIEGVLLKDAMTIRMWGEVIEISKAEAL